MLFDFNINIKKIFLLHIVYYIFYVIISTNQKLDLLCCPFVIYYFYSILALVSSNLVVTVASAGGGKQIYALKDNGSKQLSSIYYLLVADSYKRIGFQMTLSET